MLEGLKESLKILADHNDPEWWRDRLVENLRKMSLNEFEVAISERRNLLTEWLDHEYLKIPLVEERARELLAENWSIVQDFLKDPNNIKSILMQNEEIAKSGILENEETKEYLRAIAIEAYYMYREFVFREREKMMKILSSKPKIGLKELLEVAPMLGINQEMAVYIINQFEKEGIIDIIVQLKRGV